MGKRIILGRNGRIKNVQPGADSSASRNRPLVNPEEAAQRVSDAETVSRRLRLQTTALEESNEELQQENQKLREAVESLTRQLADAKGKLPKSRGAVKQERPAETKVEAAPVMTDPPKAPKLEDPVVKKRATKKLVTRKKVTKKVTKKATKKSVK